MIPERIGEDWCGLARRWILDPLLAKRLVKLAAWAPFPVQIISGYRSPDKQRALRAEGRPAAPVDRSTHTSCPSTGADVWPGIAVTRVVQAELGRAGVTAGLRWGGGSPVDPQTGIPSDWNHFDNGPRARGSEYER